MKEIKDFNFEFLEKREVNFKLLFLIFAIIFVMIYFINLLIDEKGLYKFLDLQKQEKILQQAVDRLQKENMKLQKEYFGLKDIEGD